MAENEIEISELELADELLKDMVFPVETATDTKAATLLQLKKWLGTALPVGFILPAIGKISDSRFTLLDGKTIAKNGAYREFCEKVVEQVQAGNWFACSQEEYDADLLAYGQCGRFVVENDYIRIPKLTRFIGATVTLSEIGKSFAQSLPQHTHTRGSMNITGGPIHISAYGPGNITSGAFKTTSTGSSHNDSGGTGVDISFNAANAWTGSTSGASDGTYQSGAKVQPDHVKFPYYMVVGSEGQREDIAVDFNKINEDLNRKADLNFENVESNSISLSRISREVTKCLTRIPQDIKIELNNSNLTAKKGSRVWIPYGLTEAYQVGDVDAYGNTVVATSWDGSKFFYAIELQNDLTYSDPYNGKWIIVYCATDNTIKLAEDGGSGTTTPSGNGYYYNTSTNKIDYYQQTLETGWVCSFPLIKVTSTATQITSIDQIFNGFGYIGSTVFALPGVRGLAPNGRNADGSLKNIEFEVKNVLTRNNPNVFSGNFTMTLNGESLLEIVSYAYSYDANRNINYNNVSGDSFLYIDVGNYTQDSTGKITSFTPKTTFQAVDRNDTSWLSGLSMPSEDKFEDLSLPAGGTPMIAPANGYVQLWMTSTTISGYVQLSSGPIIVYEHSRGGTGPMVVLLPVKKGAEFAPQYPASNTLNRFRFIYAEGEV